MTELCPQCHTTNEDDIDRGDPDNPTYKCKCGWELDE